MAITTGNLKTSSSEGAAEYTELTGVGYTTTAGAVIVFVVSTRNAVPSGGVDITTDASGTSAGFTKVIDQARGDGGGLYVFAGVAGAGVNYRFRQITTNDSLCYQVFEVYGTNGTLPTTGTSRASVATGSSTTATATALTAAVDDLLVYAMCYDNGGNFVTSGTTAAPSGMTNLQGTDATTRGGTRTATQTITSAGSTGTKTMTSDSGSDDWAAALLLFSPNDFTYQGEAEATCANGSDTITVTVPAGSTNDIVLVMSNGIGNTAGSSGVGVTSMSGGSATWTQRRTTANTGTSPDQELEFWTSDQITSSSSFSLTITLDRTINTGVAERGYARVWRISGVSSTPFVEDVYSDTNTGSGTSITAGSLTVADGNLHVMVAHQRSPVSAASFTPPTSFVEEMEDGGSTGGDLTTPAHCLITRQAAGSQTANPDVTSDTSWFDRFGWAVELAADTGGATDLTVADATSSSTLDAVVLTQVHSLTVADSTSAAALDAVALTQGHALTVADMLSSTTLDAVVLTQVHNLTVADSTSAAALDAVALTQDHQLVVAEMTSSSTLDNVTITVGGVDLVVADALSAGALDAVVLTQAHSLTVADLLSAGTVDNVALTQVHVLTVADMLSAGALDAPTLTTEDALSVAELTSATALDAVVLTQAHSLTVADLLSAGTVDNVALTQVHDLTVADLLSAGTVDNVTITVGVIQTPAGRVYVIASEDRTFIVPAEDRTYVIPEDNT